MWIQPRAFSGLGLRSSGLGGPVKTSSPMNWFLYVLRRKCFLLKQEVTWFMFRHASLHKFLIELWVCSIIICSGAFYQVPWSSTEKDKDKELWTRTVSQNQIINKILMDRQNESTAFLACEFWKAVKDRGERNRTWWWWAAMMRVGRQLSDSRATSRGGAGRLRGQDSGFCWIIHVRGNKIWAPFVQIKTCSGSSDRNCGSFSNSLQTQ